MLLQRIDGTDAAAVASLCDRRPSAERDVDARVAAIVDDVRVRGDAAVRQHTEAFDGRPPGPTGSYEISRDRCEQALADLPGDIRRALERARDRIAAFHERQVERGYAIDDEGVRLELRVMPLARVGIYVPGGTAAYPSSVLMNGVPARVAGVGEIVMVTPGPTDEVLAAAALVPVDRVFEIGGAQAVAALAYGTESIPRVDKIVGPGNRYVAAAKRRVYGDVDIDAIAGPSEVLIVADDAAEPRWVAADLLAQAEHDADARPVLVTPSDELIDAVDRELARQLVSLPRADVARAALERHGVAVRVPTVDAALAIAERYAPEHLELQVHGAADLAERVRCAGAVFVGPFTPEAAGDYLAGPNHVLPTAGTARFSSPLGVYDFRRRMSVLRYTYKGLIGQVSDISRLARVEGLHAHARSAAMRLAPDVDDDDGDDVDD
ncbi:MAG: histidinol dehydrogenase [Deltaproteobacteria bacterium]|nr:MAG: histidinol dehydrogenase [Deltaproteobacteria bacterium]